MPEGKVLFDPTRVRTVRLNLAELTRALKTAEPRSPAAPAMAMFLRAAIFIDCWLDIGVNG